MFFSSFIVLLAGIIVSSVDGLTCLHCTDIQSPRHCIYVMECRKGEVCNVHRTTNPSGDVVFDVGCVHPSACSNRSQLNHECDECCSSDLCNAAGCGMTGYPSKRGPVCYNCLAQITDGTCHRIDVCGINEVCMINEQTKFGDTVYTSQCVGLTHCEHHTMDISQIVGRSISDDTRSLTETACHKCCHDDLCNAHCEVDFCASDPCVYGTCVNGRAGYTCVCQQLYTGRNCSDSRRGKDCLELRTLTNVSGVYTVRPAGMIQDIEVYCDMETDGGGWTVFQRRVNGSVDFYQNLSTYENGFGDVHGEFWLGLKYIYVMASNAQTELRIDLMAADGSTAYEVHPNFRLSAAPNYTLHVDQGHGTAGDKQGLSYNNGSGFYTYDHDGSTGCAQKCQGGWWYNNCALANLNGNYLTPGTRDPGNYMGTYYHDFKTFASLKETKMMFRRV